MPNLNRRNFIFFAVSTSIAPGLTLATDGGLPAVNVSNLKIQIPRFLYFPEDSGWRRYFLANKPVYLQSLQYDRKNSHILVVFSNGKIKSFDADTSYMAFQGNMRERVVLKNLIAWVIDGSEKLARKVPGHYFETLQEQAVLETVTPAALYEYIRQLKSNMPTKYVIWDASKTRFMLN